MPIEYEGGGVVAEHTAVRSTVGLFDVSHMGTIVVSGNGATDALNQVLTNDTRKIGPGRAQYSLLCNDTGGVIDDVFLYVRSDSEVVVVPNAANSSFVIGTIQRVLESSDVRVGDIGTETAVLAVQGPQSAAVLTGVGLPTDMGYLEFTDVDADLSSILVARTGYTGEFGFELLLPAAQAPKMWTRLAASVAEHGGRLAGLGARDTLRTEMGYALHGHELSPDITPVEAGLSWAVGWDKTAFPGRRALHELREAGTAKRLVGLRCLDRAIPRPGMTVMAGPESSIPIGNVTSGTFSPTLKCGIALAFVDSDLGIGSDVGIDVRGRLVRARIAELPFVAANPRG